MAQERVQVVVRLRPLSEAELGDKEAWSSPEPTALTLSCGDAASTWQYDRVFPAPTSSDEVYKVTCKDLVSSTILGGLNSVVFAYGQTGSGKTHTISALMRLACQDTFRLIEADSGREFLLRLSAMEIYNEMVRDMLGKPEAVAAPGGLRVMDDPESGTHVEGLREEGIESVTHLEQLLRNIEQNRQVRDTRMNNSSSRGHLIVRIIVESRPSAATAAGTWTAQQELVQQRGTCQRAAGTEPGDSAPHSGHSSGVVVSTLNFVDLAGSERLSQAAMEAGDSDRLRQKEASNINRSLLTLGTVIRALGDLPAARKHVPFRDSKLTRILQPALAGNARMAIVVTISPAGRAVDTTRAALHFANAAKRVVMSPKVNKVHDESKAVIRRMQAEIEALKMAVAAKDVWQGALIAKDEEVRRASEEKVALERRLHNLEKLILTSETTGITRSRRSFDGSVDLASTSWWLPSLGPASAAGLSTAGNLEGIPEGGDATAFQLGSSPAPASGQPVGWHQGSTGGACSMQQRLGLRGARARHPAAAVARASWNPSSGAAAGSNTLMPGTAPSKLLGSTAAATAAAAMESASSSSGVLDSRGARDSGNTIPTAGQRMGRKASHAAAPRDRDGLLLNLFLSPGVRKAAANMAAASSGRNDEPPPMSATATTAVEGSQAMQSLQAQGSSRMAQEALAALRAEVLCISTAAHHSTSNAQGHSAKEQADEAGHAESSPGKSKIAAAVQQFEVGVAALASQKANRRVTAGTALDATPVPSTYTTSESSASTECLVAADAVDDAMLAAMQRELARLQALQGAQARAREALTALDVRLQSPANPEGAGLGGPQQQGPSAATGGADTAAGTESNKDDDVDDLSFHAMPAWIQAVFMPEPDIREATLGTSPLPSLDQHAAKADIASTPSWEQDDATSCQRDCTVGSGTAASRAQQIVPQPAADSAGPACSNSGAWATAMPQESQQDGEDSNASTPRSDCIPRRSKAAPLYADKAQPLQACTSHNALSDTRAHKVDQTTSTNATVTSPCLSKGPMTSLAQASSTATSTSHALVEPSGSTATMSVAQSAGASLGLSDTCDGALGWDPGRVREVLRTQKAAVTKWYKAELRRMQAEFRASAAADIAALRSALEATQDQADRLDVQKQLLLHQVLKLEVALEEAAAARADLQTAMLKLAAEKDQARYEASKAKAAARAAAVVAAGAAAASAVEQAAAAVEQESSDSRTGGACRNQLSMFDAGNDGWATQDTPDSLMPRIIELWHELAVPLAYRSRFYLTFSKKELFFSELEHRRLEWKLSQWRVTGGGAERDKALRALDWERKSLARALKLSLDDAGRDALFAAWGVNSDTKERKLQLVHKVWHPTTVMAQDGAQRSASLVVDLVGSDTDTGHFMQLVLGDGKGAPSQPAVPFGVRVGNIVKRVATPRHRPANSGTCLSGTQAPHHLTTLGLVDKSETSAVSGSCAAQLAAVLVPEQQHIKPMTPRRGSLGQLVGFLARAASGGVGGLMAPGSGSNSPATTTKPIKHPPPPTDQGHGTASEQGDGAEAITSFQSPRGVQKKGASKPVMASMSPLGMAIGTSILSNVQLQQANPPI